MPWRPVAAALLAGFALRAAFVVFAPHIEGDSLVYGDLAKNLLVHHMYGITETERIRPTLIRLPGYPLLLAAVFAIFGVARWSAVLWLQVLLDLGTCALVGAAAARIGGKRAGLVALWLAALCPFMANYTAAPLTETAVLFTVAACVYAAVRWCATPTLPWAAAMGVAVAASVLLRPDQALLGLALAPLLLRQSVPLRQRASAVAVVSAVVLLPLAFWAARNERVFHVFEPLAPHYATDPGEPTNRGFGRWYRTWAIEFASTDAVYWAYDGSPINMDVLPPRACDSPAQCDATARALALYNASSAATPESDAAFAALADERIRAHPLRYHVTMPVLRAANMWLRPRAALLPLPVRWWLFREHPWTSSVELGMALLNAAYLALAAAGLWRWCGVLRRTGWSGLAGPAGVTVLFVLLRTALLLTLDNSEPRYTLECFPVLMVWAGQRWQDRFAAGRVSRSSGE